MYHWFRHNFYPLDLLHKYICTLNSSSVYTLQAAFQYTTILLKFPINEKERGEGRKERREEGASDKDKNVYMKKTWKTEEGMNPKY